MASIERDVDAVGKGQVIVPFMLGHPAKGPSADVDVSSVASHVRIGPHRVEDRIRVGCGTG